MTNDKHYFRPDVHNEMCCDLCGEHVADSQHIRAPLPQTIGRAAVRTHVVKPSLLGWLSYVAVR